MTIPAKRQPAKTPAERERLYQEAVAREQAVVHAVNDPSCAAVPDSMYDLARKTQAHANRLRRAIEDLRDGDDVIIAGHSYSPAHLMVMVEKMEDARRALNAANKALYMDPEDLIPEAD